MNWYHPLTRVVVEALLNSLWGGILLSVAVICLLQIFRRTSAQTRFAIWWLTLLTVIGLPLLFGFSMRDKTPLATRTITNLTSTKPTPSHSLAIPEKSFDVPKGATARADVSEAVPERMNEMDLAGETQGTPQRQHTRRARRSGSNPFHFSIRLPPLQWVLFAFFGWLIIAGVMVGRVVRSYGYTRKLKRDAKALPQTYQERLRRAKTIVGLKSAVQLYDSAEASQPMAVGLIHPAILIPKSVTDQLTSAEFELVLLHELAHIKRWDNWTLLLQRLVESLLFFNPVVWWIGRKLNQEREIACDDSTVGTAGESLTYAACLTKLIELNMCQRYPGLATGAIYSKKLIFRRIEMLLDKNRNGTTCFSKFSFTAMVCMLAALLMLCSKLSVVAVTESDAKIVQATRPTAPITIAQTTQPTNPTPAKSPNRAEVQGLLNELATALNDESERVRLNVVEVLSGMGAQAATVLLEALNDESNVVRDKVVNALGEIGEAMAEDGGDVTTITAALAKALNDPSEKVRRNAAEELGQIGPQSKGAVEALIQALNDESVAVQRKSIGALGKIGTSAEPAVPMLVTALGNSKLRDEAIDALGDIGAPAKTATPALIELLNDESDKVREAVVNALGAIGESLQQSGQTDQMLETALIRMLHDKSDDIRENAADELGDIKASSDEAITALVRALHDKSDDVRENSADALASIGAPALPTLKTVLQTGSQSQQLKIIDLLGDIGPPAVPTLMEELSDLDSKIRREAVEELGDIGPPSVAAVPTLIGLLGDGSENVRSEAASALAQIGEVAVPELTKAMRNGDEPVRLKIVNILSEIGTAAVPALVQAINDEAERTRRKAVDALGDMDASSPEAVSALIKAFADPSARVRLEVIDSLGDMEITSQDAINTIVTALGDDSEDVRERAAEALGEIGRPATGVVPALIQALSDKSKKVRRAALEALKELGEAGTPR